MLGITKQFSVNGKRFRSQSSALKYARKTGATRVKVVTFDSFINSRR